MSESLCNHFQRQVRERADQLALRSADGSTTLTWGEYGAQVRAIAAGLAQLGVRRGDTVGLMLANRPEFHLVDAAAMHLGAIGFSVYNTFTADQIAFLLRNAAPTVVVTEHQFLATVRAAAEGSSVKHVITIDGDDDTMSLDELAAHGDGAFDFDCAWQAVGRDDVLTLIYTSGTTGNPKGVELTHANLLYQLEIITDVVGDMTGGRVLSYLPDAHLINRWLCQYAPMFFGSTVTDVDNPKRLLEVLGDVHPTFFVAVPMLWYKIKAAVETRIAAESGAKGALGRWALAAGRKRAVATTSGRPLGVVDAAQARLADALVLSKVRASLGLDELVAAVSGAAPIDVMALELMLALGVPVMEAWGMSETSAVTTVNPPAAPRFGTVGRPIPGTEVVLAEDGEVLVRGGGVMKGYRGDPERTAETLDADGWIHTGDIGVLEDGYLSIVDRKKELIINDGGKNMSPSNIEGAVKAASPLVGSVAAIGDQRPHVAALLTLDPDAAAAFAAEVGIAGAGPEHLPEVVAHPALQAAIGDAVTAANARLSRVEHIRTWTVLPTYWLPGGDELTPTMKLKRSPINEKYAREIDSLYAPAPQLP
ncbi:MAG TPA: long-chain fatty acid--CoA ligase [Nocardioides sp.]|nr:long-chain fatty acid--CoA ligase [Nocardioides sp.]